MKKNNAGLVKEVNQQRWTEISGRPSISSLKQTERVELDQQRTTQESARINNNNWFRLKLARDLKGQCKFSKIGSANSSGNEV